MQWTDESIAFLRDAAAMNRYYETTAERIVPQLPENAHICDAGCGIGELSLALKPYCHHVTAVDADALAIKTLKAHLIEGVTARCGDMETLAPEKPYDAMVFCLFGRTQDTLHIAEKQCRGRIFLVKRDYSHHRFSAGKVSLGEYTAGSTEAVLHEKGIPYTVERFTAEFGQPFRSLEAANLVGTCDSRSSIRHPEVFDGLGAQLIKSAPSGGIILMDELGFLENDARVFQSTVLRALDSETPVLAAVKPKDTPFLRAVRGHENAELVFIDEQNRDALLEKLLPHILRWNEA